MSGKKAAYHFKSKKLVLTTSSANNSLLLNDHVLVLGIKHACHPVTLHCSLFVSNPAAELISGKVSTGVLLFPLHCVKLA